MLLIILALLGIGPQTATSLYWCKDLRTSIYSEAPIENIEAASKSGISIINTRTLEVQFTIPIRSFKFEKSLMQEHFNENYMESDRFPNAKFKGRINEQVDFAKNGQYPVTVSGALEVHGVTQQRTVKGTITVSGESITIGSTFNVLCKDHQITIPKLVFKNIAESIQVKVSGSFTAYSPPKT